jgi:hypothetical protein
MLTSRRGTRRSDHQRELVECRGKGESRTCLDPEFVPASSQVLNEGMSPDHDDGGSVLFEAPHWAKSGFESPMIGLDSVVGVLGSVVKCSRQEF